MKVFLQPSRTMSQAMFRVARALELYAPPDIEVVSLRSRADFEVLHVIGLDALECDAKRFAVIQYCGSQVRPEQWYPLWERAAFVWSYYDLGLLMPRGIPFYLAPLGVDGRVFRHHTGARPIGVLTSGYVTGPEAEAIEEMAHASEQLGLSVYHLGPTPVHQHDQAEKMTVGSRFTSLENILDPELAHAYGQCRWVSGLRHGEGFELPVIEGLACGARPIVFDRLDMRKWYQGHAVFVPECSGTELVDHLVYVMRETPTPVSVDERAKVIRKFNWHTIATGFWAHVKASVDQPSLTQR